MRVTIFFLVALVLNASASMPSHAVERLVVGTTFSHLYEQGADGQWHGLGVDVVQLLAARAGDTVRFRLYPWPRAQAMVERAQADILVGPYKSAQRLARFHFLDLPFYRDRMLFYGRRDMQLSWQGDLNALRARRIVAVRGWHYGTQFEQARPWLDISEVPQLENGLQMLALGRVELLATNERNTTELLASLRLDKVLAVLCPDIAQLDGYLAFPRAPEYAAVRERYNALFNEMVRSGELARLGARNGVLVPQGEGAPKSGSCGDSHKAQR